MMWSPLCRAEHAALWVHMSESQVVQCLGSEAFLRASHIAKQDGAVK